MITDAIGHAHDSATLRTIPELRLQVVEYRHDLEITEDELAVMKARIEQDLIDSLDNPKELGANEAERNRRLLLHVEAQPEYQTQRNLVRALDRALGIAEAQLEGAIDRRRDDEWRLRERTVVFLESAHEQELIDRQLDEEIMPSPDGLRESVVAELEASRGRRS